MKDWLNFFFPAPPVALLGIAREVRKLDIPIAVKPTLRQRHDVIYRACERVRVYRVSRNIAPADATFPAIPICHNFRVYILNVNTELLCSRRLSVDPPVFPYVLNIFSIPTASDGLCPFSIFFRPGPVSGIDCIFVFLVVSLSVFRYFFLVFLVVPFSVPTYVIVVALRVFTGILTSTLLRAFR